MATQVQFRRGNTADNDGFTGVNGEITVDTERNELRVHNGTTAGGSRVGGTPTGSLVMWGGGASAPDGWLICDGREVSRSTYADLDAVFSGAGYPYGNGDGSTTFNLPDMRARMPIGVNDSGLPGGANSGLSTRNEGASGGDENLQSHNHYFSDSDSDTVSISDTVQGHGSPQSGGTYGGFYEGQYGQGQTNVDQTVSGSDTVNISIAGNTNNAGSGNAGNMPPFTVLNFIIKT